MRALYLFLLLPLLGLSADATDELERANGYRGIWYSNQASKDEYKYKYSGGLGTYCAKHIPFAQYAPKVDKTFFVYGGTKGVGEPKPLLEMVSYYDHKTGTVPQPAILMKKGTEDAHHNPTLSIDEAGYLWIFCSAHGRKDGFIWKSAKPYSINGFERIMQEEFTYPQPDYMKDSGFMFLFTKYSGGRELYFRTSPNGRAWSLEKKHAGFGGHYQISGGHKGKTGTAFNWHPPKVGLNGRTNLYYMETVDLGATWTSADATPLAIPLDSPSNGALVCDYQAEKRLVYMKDINFDAKGNPVILYVLSDGYESGPKNGPRVWTTARWTGDAWDFRTVTASDHNYDMGSLYIERDGTWRIIAPTTPGPQVYCTGGEIEMWVSTDRGAQWKRTAVLTANSPRNHTYVRRPKFAHPDFYALWADGDALNPSESRLYFSNKTGTVVRVLPDKMRHENEIPPLYVKPPGGSAQK